MAEGVSEPLRLLPESVDTVPAPIHNTTSPSPVWPDDEVFAHALHHGTGLDLLHHNGHRVPLAVHRWLAAPDRADESLLQRCSGRTLDIGCGPGRFSIALAQRGIFCLGIDVTSKAVELARSNGANVLCASVFDPLPTEGEWDTVLLADGNLGIAGDPDRLLARAHHLLRAGGRLLVEAAVSDVDEVVPVQLSNGSGNSGVFHWAHVGAEAAVQRARAVGFSHTETWRSLGRVFVSFDR